jgi:plasmid stabilization system protein ParE
MVTTITWNKTAFTTFNDIARYLNDNFSTQAAKNFVEAAYERIERLEKHPSIGRKVPNTKSLRMINFGKHHQMYYRVQGKTLFVCDFFDTRQHPYKKPYSKK